MSKNFNSIHYYDVTLDNNPFEIVSLANQSQINIPKIKPWIVVFHGYGADAQDLMGILPELNEFFIKKTGATVLDFYQFRFAQGPYSVPIGPGWTGRAWWTLQLSQLQQDWSNHKPAELETLEPLVKKMILDLNIHPNQIILGGFSQGAMLSSQVFLNFGEPLLGLISMSGSVINQSLWFEKIKSIQKTSVFISHGEQDGVLPIKGSQKLMMAFKESNHLVKWTPFQGAHEIPLKSIDKMSDYLIERIDYLNSEK